ncbi:Ferric reductase like transmembrane component family protein [Aspergillus niger]|uniref:Queuine tRNA-ribosyltransferase catalytic subunit 1 n=1 Tax=Aspergillus niger TaxID=5061 RepID=A0A505I857_ASPNG|nr:Ferric reductase like transmembrane component family protein [Aspergillus niger]
MSTATPTATRKPMPSALTFDLHAKCSTTKARASTLRLPHGDVPLPIFMPVATQASLKGLTYDQLRQTGCQLCLNNTYHLGLKPGQAVLDAVGGAHKLQGWDRNILTDSGGFQMVSLLKLATVTEEGVRFLSPHDGTPMLLTPEHSISLQNSIGSDIIMQLDDVIATTSPDQARIHEAMERSVRWLDRCIDAHKYPERQNLFCIIQGGLDLEMRKQCCEEMVARDTPGIAIGGLSGGEAKEDFCKVVDTCTGLLPEKKPRYVMGVGYPEDLIMGVALGADMFDCVWPTRTARFGNAVVPTGTLNLRHRSFAEDFRPVQEGCTCSICLPKEQGGLGITRAYLHHLAAKETVGAHLLTMHNVHYLLSLMGSARQAIIEDRFPAFLRDFFGNFEGEHRPDRTGTGTRSIFAPPQMRFSLSKPSTNTTTGIKEYTPILPLLTTKRVFLRAVLAELLWFISGTTSSLPLSEAGIKIWDGNGSREYLDKVGLSHREVGDLGPVYGFQWRHFGAEYVDAKTDYSGQGVDQLAEVVKKLKENPFDRRIIMSAWNPKDMRIMALPPCHMFAQFYRSADMGLGVPFNIASYALLTHLLAHAVDMVPGTLVHTLGDAHVYLDHVDALKEQIEREPVAFPEVRIKREDRGSGVVDGWKEEEFEVIGYKPHKAIKMKMSV